MKLSLYPDDKILIEGDAYEMFEYARRPSIYQFGQQANAQRYEETLKKPGRESFSGGTYDSLFTQPDMTPFIKAKEKLRDSELSRRLNAKFSNLNRRRRVLTEYDGEWDMTRQWEIQPFSNAKRQKTPHRIIDLDCHMNVSCAVTAEQICEFGCLVWAINDTIESCGINTNINFICESASVDVGSRLQIKGRINIKKAGEYINPSAIASSLTANFHRRIMFSWDVIACDFVGAVASSGLGYPCQHEDIIKFEDGRLSISSETIRNPNDKNVQDEIVKAITGNKK